MKPLAIAAFTFVICTIAIYANWPNRQDLVPEDNVPIPADSALLANKVFDEQQLMPAQKAMPQKDETEPTPEEKLNLGDINDEIMAIDRDILEKNYVTRANANTLSEEEMKSFSMLLRARNHWYSKKIQILLSEPEV